jgi:hypothetical protein
MANQATGIRKVLVSGGIVAVAAVVGMVVFDYPPATEDAAGTIVPAKRFRADGAGTSIVGDSNATQSGIATDRASTDAANAVMADGLARSQVADGLARSQVAEGLARSQVAEGLSRSQTADAVAKNQAVAADVSIRSQAAAADAVARSQAADAATRAQ